MKSWLIASACVLAVTAGSALADPGSGGKNPTAADRKERMERMREQLDLSDAQVEQIREIRKSGGSREEIRAVLTDDQRTKLDAAREKFRKKQASGEAGGS